MDEATTASLMDGSWELALFAAVAFLGGLLLERAFVAFGWAPYFSLGVPLLPALVDIPHAPEGEGKTASVSWKVIDGRALFWSESGRRTAPMGLHGVVYLTPSRRGIHLDLRWAPPWSPLLAAAWLAGLGMVQGQGHVTLPIAALMIVAVSLLYRQAAQRAAAELRWAWVSGQTEAPESDAPPDRPGIR